MFLCATVPSSNEFIVKRKFLKISYYGMAMDNKALQLFHDGSSVVIQKGEIKWSEHFKWIDARNVCFFLLCSSWHYRYLILHDAVMQFYPTKEGRKKLQSQDLMTVFPKRLLLDCIMFHFEISREFMIHLIFKCSSICTGDRPLSFSFWTTA